MITVEVYKIVLDFPLEALQLKISGSEKKIVSMWVNFVFFFFVWVKRDYKES